MKNLVRLMVASLVVALVSVMAFSVAAQEDPGEAGGVVINSTFGSAPSTFSQVYCTDTACNDGALRFMYIGLLGVDPEAAQIVPGADGALAESWTVSEDNLVYTFTLRDYVTWSDGTPITAHDVALSWELMNTPEAQHPVAYLTETIADVQVIDDYTLEVSFNSPACTALSYAAGLDPLPSHLYREFLESNEYSDLPNWEWNLAPTVTSGPFTFFESVAGQTTSLLGNDDYTFAPLGYVSPYAYVQVVSADQTVQVEQLLIGEINVLDGPPVNRRNDLRASADVQYYEYPGNTWDFIGLNIADPSNPQPALDADGNRVDQGYHPVFGDKLVRQALGHAINVDAIIESAVFGEGSRQTAHITPSSWAYNNDLPAREYNTEIALDLLAEAGWLPQNADAPASADNPLTCQGCLYATEVDSSYEGTALGFELLTNAGNTRREAIGSVVQDELSRIGIAVDFQTIDFNVLLEVTDAQTFDAYILGWRAGYPDDPNTIQIFGAASDVPGAGYNTTSFYNEYYYELEQEALNMAGCAPEDRAAIYYEMQEIMQDEMPYVWLYTMDGFYAARTSVEGFDPFPAQMFWNVTDWAISSN
jgi:peptide/nickel transport system substrate-binding protein